MFNIPIRKDPPPGFPVSTVNAMRTLTALQMNTSTSTSSEGNEKFAQALEVLWAALWCPNSDVLRNASRKDAIDKLRDANGDFDIKGPETLKGLLATVIGEDEAAKCVQSTAQKEVKDGLIANTNRAFEAGAFGIPWFECENENGEKEGFWGFDHLGQVVRFLKLDQAGERKGGQVLSAML